MLIGLLLLLSPGAVFLLTLPLSRRLKPGLGVTYRFVGGVVVFLGSGISFYFASFTGDQGGIAAFFFQVAVISVYVIFSILVIVVHWLTSSSEAP